MAWSAWSRWPKGVPPLDHGLERLERLEQVPEGVPPLDHGLEGLEQVAEAVPSRSRIQIQ